MSPCDFDWLSYPTQKSPSHSMVWSFISQLLVYFWSLSSQTHPPVDCDNLNAVRQTISSTGKVRRFVEPSREEQDPSTKLEPHYEYLKTNCSVIQCTQHQDVADPQTCPILMCLKSWVMALIVALLAPFLCPTAVTVSGIAWPGYALTE